MAGGFRKVAEYLGLVDQGGRYEYRDEEGFDDGRAPLPLRPYPTPGDLPDAPWASAGEPGHNYRITALHPRTYNDARTIGEHFREGVPVIMNLSEMIDNDAKRLVDFAAGLVFGLHGSIERVTAKVFLLTPANVEVTAEDKRLIAEREFFNQS